MILEFGYKVTRPENLCIIIQDEVIGQGGHFSYGSNSDCFSQVYAGAMTGLALS